MVLLTDLVGRGVSERGMDVCGYGMVGEKGERGGGG